MSKRIDRTGEEKISYVGEKVTIIKYFTSRNMTIQFEDGGISKNVSYKQFKEGYLKSPLSKTCCGIGYLDGLTGWHHMKQSVVWRNMFIRCYSEKALKKCPTYNDCTVHEEWHSFKNFKEWYDKNYYEVEGQSMCLDKDILLKNNKVYSSETCIFIPHSINMIFKKINVGKNEFVGIHPNPNKDKFRVGYGDKNYIGTYDTLEEAFLVYKEAKENHIKTLANKFKAFLPEKIYNILINHVVEIDD